MVARVNIRDLYNELSEEGLREIVLYRNTLLSDMVKRVRSEISSRPEKRSAPFLEKCFSFGRSLFRGVCRFLGIGPRSSDVLDVLISYYDGDRNGDSEETPHFLVVVEEEN